VLVRTLQDLYSDGDYDALIAAMREAVAGDRRTFEDPFVKQWLGVRWRDLFLKAAAEDEGALAEIAKYPGPLGRLPISRSHDDVRKALAHRFLKDLSNVDLTIELPEAQYDEIRNSALLLVPGMLTGLLHPGAHAFPTQADELQAERGWRYYRCDAHTLRGCDANGADIVETMDEGLVYDMASRERINTDPPEKVWMLGYSKGGPDIVHFLVNYPDYVPRVQAVFTWAGAMGGSFTADNIYAQIKDMDVKSSTDKMSSVLSLINPSVVSAAGLRRMDEYDVIGAFHDLQTSVSEEYLVEHADYLNSLGIPYFNVTGATTPLEVPNFQFADTVSVSRYDANNDMQLTQKQATMPIDMATHVAMLHGHHWDIAYAPFPAHMRAASPNLEHPFPKKAALIANWELLAELGVID
jgi:hypothetical protein